LELDVALSQGIDFGKLMSRMKPVHAVAKSSSNDDSKKDTHVKKAEHLPEAKPKAKTCILL
jgi:hypothetical protein